MPEPLQIGLGIGEFRQLDCWVNHQTLNVRCINSSHEECDINVTSLQGLGGIVSRLGNKVSLSFVDGIGLKKLSSDCTRPAPFRADGNASSNQL